MRVTYTSTEGTQNLMGLRTQNIKTLSLANWEVIKGIVLSGITVLLEEDRHTRNQIQFVPSKEGERTKTVDVWMDIDGFESMTEVRTDSRLFFGHEVYSTHEVMNFGVFASVRVKPKKK